jgi:hypothetical protein
LASSERRRGKIEDHGCWNHHREWQQNILATYFQVIEREFVLFHDPLPDFDARILDSLWRMKIPHSLSRSIPDRDRRLRTRHNWSFWCDEYLFLW